MTGFCNYHLGIMGCRIDALSHTLEGLRLSHTPLVQVSGQSFIPAGFTDDEGIYYFVPALAQGLGVPLDRAIDLFIGFLVAAVFLAGLAGFYLAFKNGYARCTLFFGLAALTLLTSHIGDVYAAQAFSVATVAAPLLFFLKTENKNRTAWFLFAGWAGMICGYSNFIRSQSGTGVFLFVLIGLLLAPFLTRREKWAQILLAFFFLMVPYFHFKGLENKRDEFLSGAVPGYQHASISHTFWHTAYIGLGYVGNPYGISYDDTSAYLKVKSIDPGAAYQESEYQNILKREVFHLTRTDPGFILRNLFLKGLKIIGYLLLFMNVGIPAYFYVRPPWKITAPFLFLILFGTLPGFVAVPVKPYLLGSISAATIFALYLMGMAWEKYAGERKAKRS